MKYIIKGGKEIELLTPINKNPTCKVAKFTKYSAVTYSYDGKTESATFKDGENNSTITVGDYLHAISVETSEKINLGRVINISYIPSLGHILVFE